MGGRRGLVPLLCSAALVSALLTGAATAGATKREVAVPYEPVQGEVGLQQPGLIVASVTIPAGNENYVSMSVSDQSGQPVLAEIVQQDGIAAFCGETPEPVRIDPGFDVTVQLHAGRCFGGGPSVVAGGEIRATFERLPFKPTETKAYSVVGNWTVGIDDPMPLVRSAEVYFLPTGRRFVTLEAKDTSGLPVGAKILQDDVRSDLFCGKSDKLSVNPKLPFKVLLFSGACGAGASVVTEGTVTATFSKR